MTKAKQFRMLLQADGPIMAPCAYDALSARMIEKAGFQMAGTTGYGMHGAMLGVPDNGLLAFNEMVEACTRMADAVSIPIMADAEGGYGNAINTMRTIRAYEKAGIAGVFIEDQKLPPNCPFLKQTQTISVEEMCGKIRAAVDSRTDPDFVICARTDAPFDEAVERAQAYLEAGADMIKIVPKTKDQLERLPKLVKAPLHLGFATGKEINDGMTAWDCGKLGYKIVSFPTTALFLYTRSVMNGLRTLKEAGTDECFMADMSTFDEYLDIVEADKFRKYDKEYLL